MFVCAFSQIQRVRGITHDACKRFPGVYTGTTMATNRYPRLIASRLPYDRPAVALTYVCRGAPLARDQLICRKQIDRHLDSCMLNFSRYYCDG